MTREDLVARLCAGVDADPEPVDGGILICPTPFVAPLAHLHRIYPTLDTVEMIDLERGLDRPLGAYGHFLRKVGNGARLFNLALGGLIRRVDRTPHRLGQPISLDYGNRVERPQGLDDGALAFGGMTGWSSRGVLVQMTSGRSAADPS